MFRPFCLMLLTDHVDREKVRSDQTNGSKPLPLKELTRQSLELRLDAEPLIHPTVETTLVLSGEQIDQQSKSTEEEGVFMNQTFSFAIQLVDTPARRSASRCSQLEQL